jgi:hypothetical protein
LYQYRYSSTEKNDQKPSIVNPNVYTFFRAPADGKWEEKSHIYESTGKDASPQWDDNILSSHSLKERKNTGKAASSQEDDTILSSHSLKE